MFRWRNKRMTRFLARSVDTRSDLGGFLQSCNSVPVSIIRPIIDGSIKLTWDDSLRILNMVSRSDWIGIDDSVLVQRQAVSVLCENCESHISDIDSAICAISRLEPGTGTPALKSIAHVLEDLARSSDVLTELSVKQLVNTINCLVKSPSRGTEPILRIVSRFSDSLSRKLESDPSQFDHRHVSLFLRTVSTMRAVTEPQLLVTCIERWAERSSSRESWTPQSYALFAYYLAKIHPKITVNQFPHIQQILADGLGCDLSRFTDQNLCNFAVGYGRIMRRLPERLLLEISSRDLSKSDLFFLLKADDPELVSLSLTKLSRSQLSWNDMVLIVDILSRHNGQDALLSQHGTELKRLIDCLIQETGIDAALDSGRLLYVMGRLNYVPDSFNCPPTRRCQYDSKTASSMLLTVSKLGVSEIIGHNWIEQRVDEVLRSLDSSDHALSLLSCCSMGSRALAERLLNRLTEAWSFEELGTLDKNQIMKSVVMLDIDGQHDLVKMAVLWIGPAHWDRPKRPTPSNSSRSHREVLKTLKSLDITPGIDTEVFVPTISSFIDIQVRTM